jgi:hypothetical protein
MGSLATFFFVFAPLLTGASSVNLTSVFHVCDSAWTVPIVRGGVASVLPPSVPAPIFCLRHFHCVNFTSYVLSSRSLSVQPNACPSLRSDATVSVLPPLQSSSSPTLPRGRRRTMLHLPNALGLRCNTGRISEAFDENFTRRVLKFGHAKKFIPFLSRGRMVLASQWHSSADART